MYLGWAHTYYVAEASLEIFIFLACTIQIQTEFLEAILSISWLCVLGHSNFRRLSLLT